MESRPRSPWRPIGWSMLAGVIVGWAAATIYLVFISLAQANFQLGTIYFAAVTVGPYAVTIGVAAGAVVGSITGFVSWIPHVPRIVLLIAYVVVFNLGFAAALAPFWIQMFSAPAALEEVGPYDAVSMLVVVQWISIAVASVATSVLCARSWIFPKNELVGQGASATA